MHVRLRADEALPTHCTVQFRNPHTYKMDDKLNLKVASVIWKIFTADEMLNFYRDVWGMKELTTHKGNEDTTVVLGFDSGHNSLESRLELCILQTTRKQTQNAAALLVNHTNPDDVLWKIGFNAPDVSVAVEQLQHHGVGVEPAKQLKKSGFFTHLNDPLGFKIELLQFTFEGSLVPYSVTDAHPLRQQPVLGMISLRVKDIEATLRFVKMIR